MLFNLRTQGVELNEELRREIGRRLMFAMDRHLNRLSEITLFVADVNGPRGGIDKICQLSAALKGQPPLTILVQSENVLAGLTRAARRLAYAIDKRNKYRRRDFPRTARTRGGD